MGILKMIRVAYLNFSNSGGMLHYVLNLAEAASQFVEIIYIDAGLTPTPEYSATRQPVLRINWPPNAFSFKRLNRYLPTNFRILADAIIDNANPDIVHLTSPCVGAIALASRLHQRGVKTIYTVHDPRPHLEHRTVWGSLYQTYQTAYQNKKSLLLYDAIHVHSKLHVNDIKDLYGDVIASKAYVALHGGGATDGIIQGQIIPKELEPIRNRENVRFLFFGRIQKYKGIEYLLAAQNELFKTRERAELVIAGSGTLPEIPTIPESTIIINRFIADAEVRGLFEQCDIVVLPYIEATQTGVIPLAYYFGKPVICTRVGALAEMVIDGTSGTLIREKSVTTLTDAMRNYINSRELIATQGKAARRFLDDELAWTKVVMRHHDQYLKLARM